MNNTKRYRLLKEFPNSPEIGEIISFDDFNYDTGGLAKDSQGRHWDMYDITHYPDFWEEVLPIFTADDGIDIYARDWFYVIFQNGTIVKSKFDFFTTKNDSYKYFSTKESAEQYLESLESKFNTELLEEFFEF